MTSFLTWCRRRLSWSNSGHAWAERLGTLGLLAAGFALWWYGGKMLPVAQVVLWGVLLVVAAVLLRRGWLKLFGPVLFYDMVRSARRGRYILMRCTYALLLLLLLWMVYASSGRYYGGQYVSPGEAARVAQTYFEMLMAVQLMAVLVLTPAYVAGSIADEKNRKTLEFILATDLRSREIVLSKLGSRLANLTIFIMTGLPILSFLQFLGGVDPNLVLAGFAATGLTMLGLAGISIVASTYSRRSRDAIAMSYLMLFTYYSLAFFLFFMQAWLQSWIGTPAIPFSWNSFFPDLFAGALDWEAVGLALLRDVSYALNTGNLLVILGEVQVAGYSGDLSVVIPGLLSKYALFQGILAGVCVVWSILRLRPVAVRQMSGSKVRRRGLLGLRRRRHPIGDLPMVWKEMYIEGGIRLNWFMLLITLVLIVLTFFPALVMIYNYALGMYSNNGMYGGNYGYYDPFKSGMNFWARTVTVIVGTLTLLAVAIRASTCVSSERDRQTLDGLLTTPMTASQIMGAKALGNVTSVRLGWFWLGGTWFLALITGGLHPFALPFLIGAWLTYAFVLSMVGCWFSIVSRTSQRAIVYTLLVTTGLAFGHWLPWFCCGPLMMYGGGGGPGSGIEHILMFQSGFTPPAALGVLTFYDQDFLEAYGPSGPRQVIGYSVCGLFLWLCIGLFFWSIVLQRFRQLTQRGSEFALQRLDQRNPNLRRRPPVRKSAEPESALIILEDDIEPPRRTKLPDQSYEPPTPGAKLIDKRYEPPPNWGAKLIEEIQEKPPRRTPEPPPRPQDDE